MELMKINHFEYLMDDEEVFDRGRRLYKSGAVKYLKKYACSHAFKVQGTRLYDVEICLRETDNVLTYMECNCPYGKHHICKHEVAAILYLKDMLHIPDLV